MTITPLITTRFLYALAVMMALAYMALIAWLAIGTGLHTLLFPELGALAYDVFTRPAGTWAKAPIHMVVTPTITAILGIFIARYLPFGPVAVLLSVGSTAIVLQLMKSPMAPAFSAGLLPLVLGWTTAWYPPSILFGLICLGLLAQIRQRRLAWTLPPMKRDILSSAEDVTERVASGVLWVPVFFGFVLGVAALATRPDWHVLLFPPLVVMAYEMFAHPMSCPWARRPWSLTLVCTLSAISGVIWVTWCGVGLLATLGALAVGILLLRWFDLHAPPILAVGLLPLILTHPGPMFPMAVAASLLLLNGVFILYRSGVSYRGRFRRMH